MLHSDENRGTTPESSDQVMSTRFVFWRFQSLHPHLILISPGPAYVLYPASRGLLTCKGRSLRGNLFG